MNQTWMKERMARVQIPASPRRLAEDMKSVAHSLAQMPKLARRSPGDVQMRSFPFCCVSLCSQTNDRLSEPSQVAEHFKANPTHTEADALAVLASGTFGQQNQREA